MKMKKARSIPADSRKCKKYSRRYLLVPLVSLLRIRIVGIAAHY